MKQITNLQELEKAFSIESLSAVTDYDSYFRMIAESLVNNFQITNGENVYRFVELEFYWSATDPKGRKITYSRETPAGEWFIHNNGVDINFESNKDLYGGILIRAIRWGKSFNCEGEFVNGPLNCLYWIFDGLNALRKNTNYPIIQEAEVKESLQVESFTRQGIKDSDKKFRFTIPLNLWEHKGYSGFPTK